MFAQYTEPHKVESGGLRQCRAVAARFLAVGGESALSSATLSRATSPLDVHLCTRRSHVVRHVDLVLGVRLLGARNLLEPRLEHVFLLLRRVRLDHERQARQLVGGLGALRG